MTEKKKEKTADEKPICNIVMPISPIGDYTAEHWGEMLSILRDVIESAGFTGDLVSNADEINIIHKTIVQNLYNSDIVICDVSGKNPNVMFELGLRLAFDKATIVIKDEETSFSFDTSPIEHLIYPRGLRFQQIVEFKERLKNKITATYEKSKSDQNYSTFLKHFGEFKIAHLESKEVSKEDFILEILKDMQLEIGLMRQAVSQRDSSASLRWLQEQRRKTLLEHRIRWNAGVITPAAFREIGEQINSAGYEIDSVETGLDEKGHFLGILSKRQFNRDDLTAIVRFLRANGYDVSLNPIAYVDKLTEDETE